jgi:mRNA interferase MazF
MKKGEIWLVELPSTDGSEQVGNRPAVIMAETEVNVNIIIPLTSNIQALRFPHTIEIKPSKKNNLDTISVGLIFQIRAIDKKRIKTKVGELDDKSIKEIDAMFKKMFNL